MNIRHGILLIVFCLSASTMAQAQETEYVSNDAAQQLAVRLDSMLSLSEGQRVAVNLIAEERTQGLQEVQALQGADPAAAQKRRRKVNQQFRKGLQTLLTPEQKTILHQQYAPPSNRNNHRRKQSRPQTTNKQHKGMNPAVGEGVEYLLRGLVRALVKNR